MDLQSLFELSSFKIGAHHRFRGIHHPIAMTSIIGAVSARTEPLISTQAYTGCNERYHLFLNTSVCRIREDPKV